MSAPSESFVAALTDEEICPLCLDGYAPVDEVICAVCEAPACPGCVEQLDDSCDARQHDDVDARGSAGEQNRDPTQAPGGVAQTSTRCFACRPALVPPLPRHFPEPAWSDQSEPDEGGLVVFPAWRKRPLLALARAADAVHLVEVSSLLVGWAHTGGRRFTLGERVSRVSREFSMALRIRGVGLAHYLSLARIDSAQLAVSMLRALRVRGAALSLTLELRALVLVSRTVALSRRVPQAATRACGACLRSARKPFDALSARVLTRCKPAS